MLWIVALSVSAHAQTTIDFDTVSVSCLFINENPLTTQYLAQGVEFQGVGNDGGAVLDQCGNFSVSGHSPPNFLAFNSTAMMANGGVPRPPQTMIFTPEVGVVECVPA